MAISMLKIRRPSGRLIFNMGIAIPGETVFLIETAPWMWWEGGQHQRRPHFVDDVPAEDDNDELIDWLLGHGALDQ